MKKISVDEITNLLKENGYGTPRTKDLIMALNQKNLCLSDIRCHEKGLCDQFGCMSGCPTGCPSGCPAGCPAGCPNGCPAGCPTGCPAGRVAGGP
jgi:hypothetical protein